MEQFMKYLFIKYEDYSVIPQVCTNRKGINSALFGSIFIISSAKHIFKNNFKEKKSSLSIYYLFLIKSNLEN